MLYADMVDTGNPNFFKTFKGRYVLASTAPEAAFTTDVVMLSCTNDVQIIGDAALTDYAAGDVFATLPPECAPGTPVRVPVVVEEEVAVLAVEPSGSLSLVAVANGNTAFQTPFTGTLYTSGINFNISDRWY